MMYLVYQWRRRSDDSIVATVAVRVWPNTGLIDPTHDAIINRHGPRAKAIAGDAELHVTLYDVSKGPPP